MSEENNNITEGPDAEGYKAEGQKLSEEISPNVLPETTSHEPSTFNPQPSDMEVHKHAHHVTHKKKWGEYLLEFLMLFLAVFLGFIAENIREHIVEQDRAKEFSRSLLQDLQNDTAALNNQKRSAELYIAVSDSLLQRNKTPLEGRNAAQFCFYTRFIYWTVPISWSRNTFEQIKNSGSLRYFKNDRLLNDLLKYDAFINDINSEAEANRIRGNLLLPLINSVVDPELHHELSKYFLSNLDTMSIAIKESFFSYQTASLENKREKINEMLNMVVVQQRNFSSQINGHWKQAQVLATKLMADIKKEYHLD